MPYETTECDNNVVLATGAFKTLLEQLLDPGLADLGPRTTEPTSPTTGQFWLRTDLGRVHLRLGSSTLAMALAESDVETTVVANPSPPEPAQSWSSDFEAVADNTLLRNIPGWRAVSTLGAGDWTGSGDSLRIVDGKIVSNMPAGGDNVENYLFLRDAGVSVQTIRLEGVDFNKNGTEFNDGTPSMVFGADGTTPRALVVSINMRYGVYFFTTVPNTGANGAPMVIDGLGTFVDGSLVYDIETSFDPVAFTIHSTWWLAGTSTKAFEKTFTLTNSFVPGTFGGLSTGTTSNVIVEGFSISGEVVYPSLALSDASIDPETGLFSLHADYYAATDHEYEIRYLLDGVEIAGFGPMAVVENATPGSVDLVSVNPVPAEYQSILLTAEVRRVGTEVAASANAMWSVAALKPARLGGNITNYFGEYWQGSRHPRDFEMMRDVRLMPWGQTIMAHGTVSNSEKNGGINGTELGCTPAKPFVGGTYATDHDYTGDIWRTDAKRFSLTPTMDLVETPITWAFGTRPQGDDSKAGGRWCGFDRKAGSSITVYQQLAFSDASGGYVDFLHDDVRFWQYADYHNPSGGLHVSAPYYRKYEVVSGTVEVWMGDPDSGSAVKIREITSATNGVEYSDNFYHTNNSIAGMMFLKRKAGVANTRLRLVTSYVKGAHFTGLLSLLPFYHQSTETWSVASSPGALLTTATGGPTCTLTHSSSTGIGTLVMGACPGDNQEPNRSIFWNGLISGAKKFPANGFRMSLIPQIAGSSGHTSAQFKSDMTKLGLVGARFMDMSLANSPACELRRFGTEVLPQYPHPYSARAIAETANENGWEAVWVTPPHFWTKAAYSTFLAELDEHLNPGITIYASISNETWNGQFQQFHALARIGALRGDGSTRTDVHMDLTHEMMDAWEELGSTRPFRPVVEAQASNFTGAEWMLNYGSRRYLGGAGMTIVQRLAAKQGLIAVAPYMQGTTGVDYDQVVAIAAGGAGSTKAQFKTALMTLHAAAKADTLAEYETGYSTLRTALADANVDPDAIGFGSYEVLGHTGFTNVGVAGNYSDAWMEVELSVEMADMMADHIRQLGEISGDLHCIYRVPTRRLTNMSFSPGFRGNSMWGLIMYEPHDPVLNASHMWDSIAALADEMNA